MQRLKVKLDNTSIIIDYRIAGNGTSFILRGSVLSGQGERCVEIYAI